jgi:hypothetical protein
MARAAAGRDRARFFWSCTVGFASAGAVFLGLLLGPDWDLFRREQLGGFYETQARAWFHGRWDVVATGAVRYESFVVHGRNYLYFGPWPALLRVPIIGFTHALDGRLTGVSMLLAYIVFAIFVSRFAWLTREIVRGPTPFGRSEAVGTAALAFVLAAGSSILFLASRTVVYHEAILWGVAFTTAGLFYATRFWLDGRGRSLLGAGVTTTLAVMSRVSVGLAAVAALALVTAARAVAKAAQRRARSRGEALSPPGDEGVPETVDRADGVGLGWMALATVAPLVLYAYVNLTKFGSLFGLPLSKQVLVGFEPTRRAALQANPLTGLRFVPTTVVQYLRPDAIVFDRLFPWITFSGPARVFGGAHFATLDFTSSVTTSMTVLLVLWVVGVAALFRPTNRSSPVSALRVPIIAGLVGCVSVLAFGFIANRYQGDFVPALIVGAIPGFYVCLTWAAGRNTRRAAVRIAAGTLVLLGIWTCYVNLGLALQYQRAYGVGVTDSTRADWIKLQLGIHDRIPGGRPSGVVRAPGIPLANGPNGQLLVVGNCAGLAWSDGRGWHLVERTPTTGRVHLGVQFPPAPAAMVEPLVATGTPAKAGMISVRLQPGGRIVFEYSTAVNGTVTQRYGGPVQQVEPGRNYDLDVIVDPMASVVHVTLDGRTVLEATTTLGVVVVGGPATVVRGVTGAQAPTFEARVQSRATPTPLCDRLVSS